MNKKTKWISTRIRTGWGLLGLGVFVIIGGVFTELRFAHLPYNFRILTGLGILLAGVGIAHLIRYGTAIKDDLSARRLTVEEKDERTILIRARAGNKAFWVSVALAYTGLMWASYADTGGLPALCGDTLWFFLAGCVLLPFGVYIINIVVQQRNS